MIIDYTQIDIFAGNGGSGAVSFRRENSYQKVVPTEVMVEEADM